MQPPEAVPPSKTKALSSSEHTQADQVWSSLSQRLESGEVTLTLPACEARLLLAEREEREQEHSVAVAELQRMLNENAYAAVVENERANDLLAQLAAKDAQLAEVSALVRSLWDIAGRFGSEQCNAIRDPIHSHALPLAAQPAPEPTLREALEKLITEWRRSADVTEREIQPGGIRERYPEGPRYGIACARQCADDVDAALASVSPPPQEGREP